jgi:hypothetical protein
MLREIWRPRDVSVRSVTGGESRRRGLEIDSLHRLPEIVAGAHQVAEVLVRDIGFDLVLACRLLLLLQLLDVALQTDAHVVCGALECATNL